MATAVVPNVLRAPRSDGFVVTRRTLPSGLIWSSYGHYQLARDHLLLRNRTEGPSNQAKMLAWLRDHVSPEIPRIYYEFVLGHDLHVSTWAELYVRHHHATQRDPFFPDLLGWTEDVGRVSRGKVTTAFRDFESACLVTDQTSYGDFKYHEVGLGTTAEANTQTALTNSSGIARTAGSQSNPWAFTYQTIALTVADTTETWAEHGLFNVAAAGVLLDRSLLAPTIAVQAGDTVEWTYVLTKSAEA